MRGDHSYVMGRYEMVVAVGGPAPFAIIVLTRFRIAPPSNGYPADMTWSHSSGAPSYANDGPSRYR